MFDLVVMSVLRVLFAATTYRNVTIVDPIALAGWFFCGGVHFSGLPSTVLNTIDT